MTDPPPDPGRHEPLADALPDEIPRLRAEVARLQAEVARAREEARVAARAKSAFLANMSHELRTPLNAILGYAELLQEDARELEAQALLPDLEKIRASGTSLLTLINEILDLARIEAGRAAVYPEPIDVAELCDEALGQVAGLAEENGITLRIEREEDLTSFVCDRRKVLQCLTSLLSNACKFTSRGRVTLRIRRDGARGVIFAVEDTGIGIAADQLEAIFREFHQLDDSTTRGYGGTGLGLTITRRLLDLLGGQVTVQSEPGRGSTFTMRVPDLDGRPGHPANACSTAARAQTGGPTVLVVDDDPTMRELLRRYLEAEGYAVIEACSGAEAVRFAEQHRPAVICLDAVMPDMDGWSTLRVIKSRPTTASIPVVMVTMVDDRSRGIVLGAAEYLVKPIRRDTLLGVVKRFRPRPQRPILVVEDDKPTREVTCRMLRSEGYEVLAAENGRIALERLDQHEVSVVLLDLMMPELDGFQVVAEIRRNPRWAHLPIVVLTAMDIPPSQRGLLELQVQSVIRKGGHDRVLLVEEIRKAIPV